MYDPLCGAGAEVLKTWQQAQLEPNTLIETEYLSANAQARAEAYGWKRLRKKANLLSLV